MTSKVAAYRIALLVGCISIVGLIIRLYFFVEPLWIDELHSAWVVSGNFIDVASRASRGNQSPLYFWSVYWICSVFSLTETTLRAPSVGFGMGSMILGCCLAYRLTKDIMATLFVAVIFATESWFVFWSTEARPYAMLQMFGMIQFMILYAESTTKPKDTKPINLPLLLSTAVLPLIHLSSVFWIAWQAIYCLISLRRKNSQRALASILIASVVSLTLISTLEQVISQRNDWNYFGDPINLAFETGSLWTMLVLSIAIFGFACLTGNVKKDPADTNVSLLIIAALGPILSAGLASFLNVLPIAAARYVAPSLYLLPLLCASLLNRVENWKTVLTIGVLISGFATNPIIQNAVLSPNSIRFRNENWKSAINQMKSSESHEAEYPIFLFANLFEDHRISEQSPDKFVDYLRFPLTGIYPFGHPERITPMPTLSRSRWTMNHLSKIKETKFAHIVARVAPHDMNSIVDELKRLGQKHQVLIQAEVFHQKGNHIRIATISIAE